MGRIKEHLEAKFIAGTLAAIPLGVTAFVFWYIDHQLRALVPALRWPAIGIVVALLVIYGLGVFVTSWVGRSLLRVVDWVFNRVPGLRDLYRPWKQIALTSDMETGMFARVVLVPDETGKMSMMGFTSGRPVDGTETVCVFVPASPNPIHGRLYFVPLAACRTVDVGAKEALKFIVSQGNYIPPGMGASLGAR